MSPIADAGARADPQTSAGIYAWLPWAFAC